MHWHRLGAVGKAITLQSSMSNLGSEGRFTIELGFVFTELGEHDPERWTAWDCRHRLRVSDLLGTVDRWWEVEDAESSDVRRSVADELRVPWEAVILPFVDACDDPRAYLAHLLTRHGPALLEASRLATNLGDVTTTHQALDRYLEQARSDDLVPDPQWNSHPMRWLVHEYLQVVPPLEAVGRRLEGQDVERAGLALEAEALAIQEGQAPLVDPDKIQILTRHLSGAVARD